jgi:hypothetical protein
MAGSWNLIDVVIIGAASTVLGAIVVNKYFTPTPTGAGQPAQMAQASYTARAGQISPYVPCRTPPQSAPLAQNTPITEAAYNTQPTCYSPTLGPEENASGQPLLLPA